MIKEAFFELMDTVGFDKISVQDLTTKAMVSRTTFYLHYKDKYDLLDQIENEILDGFKSMATNLPLDEMVTIGLSHEKPFSLLLRIYKYVKENQQFFKLIMGKNGDPSFYYKLSETMKLTAPRYINADKLKIPEHYAIAFTIGVQTSIINEWLKTGMKETPQEIVSMVAHVMQDVPKNIFK
jgi:Transcriptional regulator